MHSRVAILILISMFVSGCSFGGSGSAVGSPTATPHVGPSGGVTPAVVATSTSAPRDSAITPAGPVSNASGPESSPDASRPPVIGAGPGWNKLEPGGDTTCARGTPYAFWAHRGSTNKLLVFFEG